MKKGNVRIGRESMNDGGMEREVMLGSDLGLEGGQDALGDSMEVDFIPVGEEVGDIPIEDVVEDFIRGFPDLI